MRAGPIAGATLTGSILFYVLANFAVWASGTLYSRTIEGLGLCYVAALPRMVKLLSRGENNRRIGFRVLVRRESRLNGLVSARLLCGELSHAYP